MVVLLETARENIWQSCYGGGELLLSVSRLMAQHLKMKEAERDSIPSLLSNKDLILSSNIT